MSPSSWRVRVRPPDLGMGFHPKSIVVEVSSLIHPVPGAPDSCEIRLNFAVPRKALASGAVFDQRVAPTLETRAQIDADSPFCPNLEGLDFARTVLRIDRFERDRISGHVQGTLAQTTLTATVEHSCTNDFVTLQPSASQLAFSIPLQDVYVD